jgi:ATP-dependent RNA helicase RhlE
MTVKFADLRLAEPILRAVAAEGYDTATPIQALAIPHALDGRDVLGCAQTGTGKTAAFALPILDRLTATPRQHPADKSGRGGGTRRPRALVLAPTRELALQIAESFSTYGRHVSLRSAVVFGGVNQNPQVDALRRGVDILIATPGRLLDLIQQGHCDIRGVEAFVLDEADRMLDMGFIHDIRRIADHIPPRRQTMLFSATMPAEIRRLVNDLLHNPETIEVAPVSATAERIEQSVFHVARKSKPALLAHLVDARAMHMTIVFTRTKHGADRVVRQLYRAGIRAEAIHGNKSQNARQKAMENFRRGKVGVLVATDIAARGIDVDGITHVVNYDLPAEAETYVHRIGRTARAGASGKAIAFCDPEERGNLRAIERLIRRAITVEASVADLPTLPDHPLEQPARPERRRQSRPAHSGYGTHKPTQTPVGDGGGSAGRRRGRRRTGRRPAMA